MITKLLKRSKPIILRIIVASVLWILIISCFLLVVRTSILTTKAIAYIDRKAISPAHMRQDRQVMELARQYVEAWSTFDNDRLAYEEKLSLFGDSGISQPDGIQKCNSTIILDNQTDENNKKIHRVLVGANLSRVVTTVEGQGINPPEERVISRKAEGDEQVISFWKDYMTALEVTIKDGPDGSLSIVGTPVCKAYPLYQKEDVEDMVGSDDVPKDFQVFAAQALEMYFSGKNMDNFLDSHAEIQPVNGYTVENVHIQAFSLNKGKARAVAIVDLSTEGLKNLRETVVMDAVKDDRWLLLRLGGY